MSKLFQGGSFRGSQGNLSDQRDKFLQDVNQYNKSTGQWNGHGAGAWGTRIDGTTWRNVAVDNKARVEVSVTLQDGRGFRVFLEARQLVDDVRGLQAAIHKAAREQNVRIPINQGGIGRFTKRDLAKRGVAYGVSMPTTGYVSV